MLRGLPFVLMCGLVACVDFESDRAKCRADGRCGAVDGGGTGGTGGFSGDGGVGGGSAGGTGGSGGTGGGGGGGSGGGPADDAGMDAGVDGGSDGGADGGCAPGFHDDCGRGACRKTIPACVPDSDTTSCTPGVPGVETCNLVDDDCNGRVDDGDLSCGAGVCARTVPACVGGTGNTCTPGTPAAAETCNGLDDDCTGVAEQGRWLADLFAPGKHLDVSIACQQVGLGGLGTVRVADQGGPNCMATSCGRLNGVCNAQDIAAAVSVTVTGLQLTYPDAGEAAAALTLDIASAPIYVSIATHPGCIITEGLCSYRFVSTHTMPATNTARATIQGSADGGLPQLVSLKLTSLQGTQVCGATGAGAPPQCLATPDLIPQGENACGNTICSQASLDPVRAYLLGQLGSALQAKIRDVIETQVCEPCGTGVKACPP